MNVLIHDCYFIEKNGSNKCRKVLVQIGFTRFERGKKLVENGPSHIRKLCQIKGNDNKNNNLDGGNEKQKL